VLPVLILTGQAFGQFPGQKPIKRDPAEVKRGCTRVSARMCELPRYPRC